MLLTFLRSLYACRVHADVCAQTCAPNTYGSRVRLACACPSLITVVRGHTIARNLVLPAVETAAIFLAMLINTHFPLHMLQRLCCQFDIRQCIQIALEACRFPADAATHTVLRHVATCPFRPHGVTDSFKVATSSLSFAHSCRRAQESSHPHMHTLAIMIVSVRTRAASHLLILITNRTLHSTCRSQYAQLCSSDHIRHAHLVVAHDDNTHTHTHTHTHTQHTHTHTHTHTKVSPCRPGSQTSARRALACTTTCRNTTFRTQRRSSPLTTSSTTQHRSTLLLKSCAFVPSCQTGH
jgi:hypothetical protein